MKSSRRSGAFQVKYVFVDQAEQLTDEELKRLKTSNRSRDDCRRLQDGVFV